MPSLRLTPLALALFTSLTLVQIPSHAQSQAAVQMPHSTLQAAPHQVLHLSASAQTEVPQDWLVMILSVQKEGIQGPCLRRHLSLAVEVQRDVLGQAGGFCF